jgi:uncharacterized protein YbjT (DUF2867 family)
MSKKTIVVFGATGAQGGGLARAILENPSSEFAVRAVTRKGDSPAAQALRKAGAQVVVADADRPETLKPAVDGAWGAFCVTNFWEHFSAEREIAQARAMAQAVASAGLKHVVWSTLEDTRTQLPPGSGRMPVLGGKYNVPHFDAKGEADRFFRELDVPTTYLLTSFYWVNLIYFGMQPARGANGRLAFTLPMGRAKLPGIAAGDIGACALGVFAQGESAIGKRIGIAGEHLGGDEMAQRLGDAFGEPVDYNAVTAEQYRGFGFPGADDLGNMFQFKEEFEPSFRAARDVQAARRLHPGLQTFAQWLERNKARIPVK